MKKDLTEIVFILDRSGSMSGLEADTIGGFNAMIEKQKQAEGEAYDSPTSLIEFALSSEIRFCKIHQAHCWGAIRTQSQGMKLA